MSKQLGQALGRPGSDDPWVAPDEVRKTLHEGDVLVEIASFNMFDFQSKDREKRWQPAHYAAWVVPPLGHGEVRVLDLGPAAVIEEAVAAARRALRPDGDRLLAQLRQEGEREVERQAYAALETLAARVLAPLLPHIGSARRWIISPDAALWLVPWAALPLEDGRYAIEAHEIHYVISGRDLVDAAGPSATGTAMHGDG